MPNSRTATEILAVVKQAVQFQKFTAFVLPSFAAFLTGKSIPYLCNGISSSISLVSGGTLYTNNVFTIPLTGNYPAGSVAAVVTFTNTGGVLSAPVATVPGSGYGTASFLWSPPDPTGSGCQVLISPANPDQVYNWTPGFVGFLQNWIGLDYAQIGNLMNGSVGANTASAVNVHSGAAGLNYVAGDTAIVTLAGMTGCRLNVASVGGSGSVTALTINIGGVGATVASNCATTGGSGTGLAVDITAVVPYNWYTNTIALAGWAD
jgi:hypothetical protein